MELINDVTYKYNKAVRRIKPLFYPKAKIVRPDNVCNLIEEEIKDESIEIDYTLFNKKNNEVESIFCILQNIRKKCPPAWWLE